MRILGIVLAQDLQENVPRRNIAHIGRPFEASISATADFGRETPTWPGVKAAAWTGIETTAGFPAETTATTV
jgi:hypothetical protein